MYMSAGINFEFEKNNLILNLKFLKNDEFYVLIFVKIENSQNIV